MNQKQFKTFNNHVKKWRDYFGLKSWEIGIETEVMETDVVARTSFDMDNRWACIRFNDAYTDNLSDNNLNRTAFHEVCEILLIELRYMSERLYNYDRVDRVVHRIIRTLENVMLK